MRDITQGMRRRLLLGNMIFVLLVAYPGVASSNAEFNACLEKAKNNHERSECFWHRKKNTGR